MSKIAVVQENKSPSMSETGMQGYRNVSSSHQVPLDVVPKSVDYQSTHAGHGSGRSMVQGIGAGVGKVASGLKRVAEVGAIVYVGGSVYAGVKTENAKEKFVNGIGEEVNFFLERIFGTSRHRPIDAPRKNTSAPRPRRMPIAPEYYDGPDDGMEF